MPAREDADHQLIDDLFLTDHDPRDLLAQIQHYCSYNGLPIEMRPEHSDRVVKSYFTVVINK